MMWFVCYFAAVAIYFGAFFGLVTSGFWFDRFAVMVLRRSGLGPSLYPTAVSIAVSITSHPEQWSSSGYQLTHPDIGAIWTSNAAYGIEVKTEFGTWKPNFIERRIIREAVDWRIGHYLRDRLEIAMRKDALR